jgi:hypothetical protein
MQEEADADTWTGEVTELPLRGLATLGPPDELVPEPTVTATSVTQTAP